MARWLLPSLRGFVGAGDGIVLHRVVMAGLLLAGAAVPAAIPAAAGPRSCAGTDGDGVAVFDRMAPSVVSLEGSDGRGGRAFGTGLVWSAGGLVVTNRHVVQQMTGITLAFHDGRRVAATAVAAAPDADIALVQAAGQGPFTPVAVAHDAAPRIGERVFAIGNPYGIGLSLSQGIVSGIGRTVDLGAAGRLEAAIQTDASLNPGNSGGALIDRRGCLIGMNAAILSPTGSSAGIGFALPAAAVAETVGRLLAGGPAAGPEPRRMTDAGQPGSLGIVASFTGSGLLVEAVSGGSLADRLGSQVGDVITHVNGVPVRGLPEVIGLIRSQPVRGVTIRRNGRLAELRAG